MVPVAALEFIVEGTAQATEVMRLIGCPVLSLLDFCQPFISNWFPWTNRRPGKGNMKGVEETPIKGWSAERWSGRHAEPEAGRRLSLKSDRVSQEFHDMLEPAWWRKQRQDNGTR